MKQIIMNAPAGEIVAAIVIAILVLGMAKNFRSYDLKNRRYFQCLVICFISLVLDAISYGLDGSGWPDFIAYPYNALTFLLIDAELISFAYYLHALLIEKNRGRINVLRVIVLLALLDSVLLIVHTCTGRLFDFYNGRYVAGPAANLVGILPMLAMLYAAYSVIRFGNGFSKKERNAVLSYLCFPLISGIITFIAGQTIFSVYTAAAISYVVIYVFLHNSEMEENRLREELLAELSTIDGLTGLNNRRAFDTRIQSIRPNKKVGVLYCDLNELKYTNDKYGHKAGDRLIVRFSELLKKYFRQEEIYRISGDEFLVVMTDVDKEIFEGRVFAFEREIDGTNPMASCGYAFGREESASDVVKEAEELMYKDKERYYVISGKNRRI